MRCGPCHGEAETGTLAEIDVLQVSDEPLQVGQAPFLPFGRVSQSAECRVSRCVADISDPHKRGAAAPPPLDFEKLPLR